LTFCVEINFQTSLILTQTGTRSKPFFAFDSLCIIYSREALLSKQFFLTQNNFQDIVILSVLAVKLQEIT